MNLDTPLACIDLISSKNLVSDRQSLFELLEVKYA